MIEAMRDLALIDLGIRFGNEGNIGHFRAEYGAALATLLVEPSEKISRVYVLEPVPELPGLVRMRVEDLDDRKRLRLPFVKPTGSQSAAVGPIIKRTWNSHKTPSYGPSLKTQATTRKHFRRLSNAKESWSQYFREICQVLTGQALIWEGREFCVGRCGQDPTVLAAAIRLIPEKERVFVTVADSSGRWPGDREDFREYLAEVLAGSKYVTTDAPRKEVATCPLCDKEGAAVYPNALRGAGINFGNMDRAGAFPGLSVKQAWKAYGLCIDCADLLYIFKNHVSQKFLGTVAGEKALLLPSLIGEPKGRGVFVKDFKEYVKALEGNRIKSIERDLMEFLAEQSDAHVVLHILWADFGQEIKEAKGTITEVLPSRLQDLVYLNRHANECRHPLFPAFPLQDASFDLSLRMLRDLFRRPHVGSKEREGLSKRLFEIKRDIAAAIYHGETLKDRAAVFWSEIIEVARSYIDEAIERRNSWGLVNEGVSIKKGIKTTYWTLAGWIRHLARLLYYMDLTGVIPMCPDEKKPIYQPEMSVLQPYFTCESGINSAEKAFAFLLGILFGKMTQVQAARGVNVASNALTWLKRLRLDGRDLPELYVKIREKLITYETEQSAQVRELVQEIGRLGIRLGDNINLDTIPTCYFMLLGQSLTNEILPSKS